ncbi:Phosphoenolpyruvate/pyruvate domain-containing protein [Aspergillus sclerotiicarbonarius CBS 121057]|uniref:Phosphoenolpyruvate/pyruvate domain-containing protein n=1 Tax=Aspergillus sclerotiicarbonarius (strain CBS 121057 / IBT 28362) TaxID=1448318 RepID=A0A319ERL7_ASPSB|nr:Phosphoenolpyruvate/pyruvate domain-containing protein [Aspergillus sclerotiicarbonarius CBS 121057]
MSITTPIRSSLQAASASSSSPSSAAFGFWLTLPSSGLAKTILHGSSGSSTKFSWVLVDAEHGLISDYHYYELNNAISSTNASPIIRVPYAEEWMIKRALDAGAHGIMTPMCHTADDATNIVKYTRYPPQGTRGYGPMFAPHSLPGVNPGPEYDDNINDGVTVCVQIESRSGVENVEKIAAVEGIDVLFIGPFDLAKQMGVLRGSEEHESAIQRVLDAARKYGKIAAIFCTDGVDSRKRAEQGFHMISVTTDVNVIRGGMLGELKVAVGEAGRGSGSGGSGY